MARCLKERPGGTWDQTTVLFYIMSGYFGEFFFIYSFIFLYLTFKANKYKTASHRRSSSRWMALRRARRNIVQSHRRDMLPPQHPYISFLSSWDQKVPLISAGYFSLLWKSWRILICMYLPSASRPPTAFQPSHFKPQTHRCIQSQRERERDAAAVTEEKEL